MKLKSFDHFNCSLAQTLSVIGEHWTLLIIRDVFFGLRHFDQFQKDLGIARNMLSTRLKKLVEAGVLEKSAGDGHPEYRLTEKAYGYSFTISLLRGGENISLAAKTKLD